MADICRLPLKFHWYDLVMNEVNAAYWDIFSKSRFFIEGICFFGVTSEVGNMRMCKQMKLGRWRENMLVTN